MPRRLNYTGRKRIDRADAAIRLENNGNDLIFNAHLRLAGYNLDPSARVYVEAYRTASTLWKRFDFGRVGTLQPPADRDLDEFGVPEGILFRVKVTADGDAKGKLLAEADAIRPRLPDEQDEHGTPLIKPEPGRIGYELWRVRFDDDMPVLVVNDKVPGWSELVRDPLFRSLVAPAIMRQVLARILITEPGAYDDEDETDWRVRWIRFAERLPGVVECCGPVDNDNPIESVETWIDEAVGAFAERSGLFDRFLQVRQQGAHT